jgi:peptidoglycan/LPS O-acetylase OafA/YrhL
LPTALFRFVHSGYAAVSLFFVLSGFVLVHSSGPKLASGETRRTQFWVARLARIYPLYLVALVGEASAFRFVHHVPWAELRVPTAASLFAVQAWFPSLMRLTNVPAWSICDELFFYLLFPFLLDVLFRNATARRTWGVLVVAWLAGLAVAGLAVRLDAQGPALEFVLFAPICRLPEFVIGMALAHLVRADHSDRPAASGTRVTLLALGALVLITQVEPNIPLALFHNALLAPLFALLIFGLARGGGPARVLAWRPLVVLGEASFALYIIQFPFANLFWVVFKLDPMEHYALRVGSMVATAVLLHYALERPARRLLTRIAAR